MIPDHLPAEYHDTSTPPPDSLWNELEKYLFLDETAHTSFVIDVFECLCCRFLIPWHNKITETWRIKFAEKGLPKRFVELAGSSNNGIVEVALKCIWSYGETGEDREQLAALGALPLVIKHSKSEDPNIQIIAMGALWGLLEYEDVQEQAVNEGVISSLMYCPNVWDDERLVSELVGCIFCCASNVKCRPLLSTQGVVPVVFEILEKLPNATMVRFFCCLTLAFFCEDKSISESLVVKVLEAVRDFLATTSPADISSIEERDQYSWRTVMPFYNLTSSSCVEFRQLGLFCLAHLSKRAPNRKVILADGILSNALCFCWDPHEPTRLLAIEMSKMFYPITPPSLLQITRFFMRNDAHLDEQASEYELSSSCK